MQSASQSNTAQHLHQAARVIPIGANAYFFPSNSEDALTVSVPTPFSRLDLTVTEEINLNINPVEAQFRLHVIPKTSFPTGQAQISTNMKIMAWNCCSPHRPDFESIVAALCATISPEIIVILNTHAMLGQMISMTGILKYESFQYIPPLKYSGTPPNTQPERTLGGIWVAWKKYGMYLDRSIMNGKTTYLQFLPMYAGCPLYILPPPHAPAGGGDIQEGAQATSELGDPVENPEENL